MSWFGEQLRERINKDDRTISRNLRELSDAVTGKKQVHYAEGDSAQEKILQIESVCRFFQVEVPEKMQEFDNINEQIEYIIQPSGMTKRRVRLNDTWWRDGDCPLLVVVKGTTDILALLPSRLQGYYYIDPEKGRKVKVTRKNKDLFESEAYCFYKPLPQKALTGKEYTRFLLKEIRFNDIAITIAAALCATLFGMLTPTITQIAFSNLIPSDKSELLAPLAVLLFATAIGSWLMNSVRSSLTERIKNRLDVFSENAVYSRVINLPAGFFGDKSSGGVARCVTALNMMPQLIGEILCGSLLTMLVSVIYILQIGGISPPLATPALVAYLAELLFIVLTMFQEQKIIYKQMTSSAEDYGAVFDFISGIQKIKISGSEKRAFSKWLEGYTKKAEASFTAAFPTVARQQLITTIYLLGTLWIYVTAYRNSVSLAQFAAFSSAFGLAMGSLTALGPSISYFAYLDPILQMGEPILQEVPEQSFGKKNVQKLSGRIELSNVSFRYSDEGRLILDELNLTINPGDYVAIVGKSGCGKSTLMKLLLGFITPNHGAVYYDGTDLEHIDKRSLRRNIGSVMQNSSLFTGDIFSNITIAAPWLNMDAAWDAAEKAGIAEDIRRMPMGMHTYLSEGGGGISGGQRQRLIIARAIAPKPNILFFDESTSALDNLTQKVVTESLNALHCTRIVIAHRLSTIKDCDRIICLDHGKIIEDGTYDELIARNGFFAELVSRQQIDEE